MAKSEQKALLQEISDDLTRLLAKIRTAIPEASRIEESIADRTYGYAFGCDGLVGLECAAEMLGGVSRDTL